MRKKLFLPLALVASILFTTCSVQAEDATKILIGRKDKFAYEHAENVLKIAMQNSFEEYFEVKTENENLKLQVEALKTQLGKCQAK
jgi:peptidoglycan hydrolase CwlO-like protein